MSIPVPSPPRFKPSDRKGSAEAHDEFVYKSGQYEQARLILTYLSEDFANERYG